jgi:hypothetical protein
MVNCEKSEVKGHSGLRHALPVSFNNEIPQTGQVDTDLPNAKYFNTLSGNQPKGLGLGFHRCTKDTSMSEALCQSVSCFVPRYTAGQLVR